MQINRFTKMTALGLSFGLILQTAACGTILHPERKGQTGGQIDPAVAILNGIGLLFYVIPGAIAFAVDFYNGTIYLPGGATAQLTPEELDRVSVNGEVDTEQLELLVEQKVNMDLDLQASNVQVRSLQSEAQLQALLATHQAVTLARN